MKVNLPYVMVNVVRGEGSKTPVVVFPHEIDILKEMLGEGAVRQTDEALPEGLEDGEFETEDEYVRLQQHYRGDAENPNPTTRVFRNLDEFEKAFASVNGEDKAALLEEALSLGIKATSKWSVKSLKEAIAKAKGE